MVQTSADEERYRGLVASGAVSQSVYDQIKASADSARANLASLEAQLKIARDDEQYGTLVADRDGTIVDTLAEPGQFVLAGQIVLRIAYSGPREAVVYLPETLRPKPGSAATVVLHGGDSRTSPHYAAHLRQLSDSADQGSCTFEARYVLDGVAGTAPLGATVTVFIEESAEGGAVEVPLGAIDDEGRGPGVWVLDSRASAVTYRQVKLLRFAGEGAIVSGSLRQGDPIVFLGGHFLHQGQQVRIADRVLGTE
jgi:RND family efflux transporter MFP subunit